MDEKILILWQKIIVQQVSKIKKEMGFVGGCAPNRSFQPTLFATKNGKMSQLIGVSLETFNKIEYELCEFLHWELNICEVDYLRQLIKIDGNSWSMESFEREIMLKQRPDLPSAENI